MTPTTWPPTKPDGVYNNITTEYNFDLWIPHKLLVGRKKGGYGLSIALSIATIRDRCFEMKRYLSETMQHEVYECVVLRNRKAAREVADAVEDLIKIGTPRPKPLTRRQTHYTHLSDDELSLFQGNGHDISLCGLDISSDSMHTEVEWPMCALCALRDEMIFEGVITDDKRDERGIWQWPKSS